MLQSAVPILASLSEEETVEFYTGKLGFTFHSGWDGYLIFGRDRIFIHHWPCQDPEIPKATGCYINVTNVDALYAEFKVHDIIHPNGDLQNMPWEMRQFSILDNNGNIIHFGQDISKGDGER